MRLQIISSCLLLVLGVSEIRAQQTDPTLTAAVVAQSEMLSNLFEKREKTQQKILTAESAITLAMTQVHNVENQMLSYLSNVQVGMQNLYQVKRCAELVTTLIPKNISFLTSSVPGHLKGTAIAALVSDRIQDATLEMTSLYPFMKQLVTNGSYDVTTTSGKEQHKVNLLNSAERYYVANEIQTKLEKINMSIYMLAWEIRTYTWQNLWFGLDPEGWCTIMAGKAIATNIINQWKNI